MMLSIMAYNDTMKNKKAGRPYFVPVPLLKGLATCPCSQDEQRRKPHASMYTIHSQPKSTSLRVMYYTPVSIYRCLAFGLHSKE